MEFRVRGPQSDSDFGKLLNRIKNQGTLTTSKIKSLPSTERSLLTGDSKRVTEGLGDGTVTPRTRTNPRDVHIEILIELQLSPVSRSRSPVN